MIFFLYNFFKSVVNRKEPETQFTISAPAPGNNLIWAPRFRNTATSPRDSIDAEKSENTYSGQILSAL